MYNVARNNFYENEKNATVYTPQPVAGFLFDILHEKITGDGPILDPCVGAGALLAPFRNAGFETVGIDIEDQGFPGMICRNFLETQAADFDTPALVIMNPPFNIDEKTKCLAAKISGARPLLPEVWLRKSLELWGLDVPICLFSPYGLRLNQTTKSKRWRNFADGRYPEISSIVSLPKDIYEGVLFHSEILIFNVQGLKAHYFYDG